jgi:hypothetical protein
MQNNQEGSRDAVTKMTLLFLAEAIGQCPAGLEKSTNRDIVFAVVGFQYGAATSAAYVAGLDGDTVAAIADEVVRRINGMDSASAAKFLSVMPMLAGREYPPIGIGGKAIISFSNAASEEDKLVAATSLRELLRQIDEA